MKIRLIKTILITISFSILALGNAYASTICINCGDASSDFGTGASLQELLDGASILVDDKLFDNFTLLSNTGNGDGDAPILSNIEVMGLDDQPLNPGLRFISNDEWYVEDDLGTTGEGGSLYTLFEYEASVQDPLLTITDVSLQMSLGTDNSSPGGVGIFDFFDVLNTFGVYTYPLTPFNQMDFTSTPLTFLSVQTSVAVSTNALNQNSGGVGDLEYFDQRFSQTPIPEPTSLLLLGTGLGILWLGINRRRKR